MNALKALLSGVGRVKPVASGLLLAITLVACGGGTSAPNSATQVQLRALPQAFIFREAVAYSPYRTSNRDSEVITKTMIEQDLRLLTQAGIGLIRLFDSSDAVARQVLEVIRDQNLDLKVMLGIWIAKDADSGNQFEIARGIALANAHKATVLAVSVGNETLVSWTAHPQQAAQLARYIQTVRNAVSQPVTTNENWAVLAKQSGEQDASAVIQAIDFVAMHTYPLIDTVYNPNLWNWKQTDVAPEARAQAMMDAALARAQFEFRAVKNQLSSLGLAAMPIVVGETGWKAVASGNETQRAHPVNQKMYWDRLKAWKASADGPKTVVYFEAFDEPWKGADDKWGLFNVNRQARCAVQGLDSGFVPEAGSCDLAQAVYYVPVQNSGTITANRYTVYADVVTNGEAEPAVTPVFNAWEGNTTAEALPINNTDSTDGPQSLRITPKPMDWGWGMTLAISDHPDDLSQFDTASGRLNFSIKTTYPGKIEVGFLTGTAADSSLYDVYWVLEPGQYGYQNNGQWQQVSIPITQIKTGGAPAYGMQNSSAAVLDLTRVTNPFVIADRFAKTGKADQSQTPLEVDAIFWSK
jgi:exo-beta-1,3-glucanase (GH17 family)